MVRMHLAMMLGHFAEYPEYVDTIIPALLQALDETRVFTKSWAIVSLCIYACKYPRYWEEITKKIAELSNDPSKAIKTKVRYAMEILSNDEVPFPKGWVKSERVLSDKSKKGLFKALFVYRLVVWSGVAFPAAHLTTSASFEASGDDLIICFL